MWFRNVHIRSFAGIKEADIGLTPGLNVLHGPNELGKSTLLLAIRAALLLSHSSAKHRHFVDWHEDRPPTVALTFETEEQRIWRVRKSFGTGSEGSSLLEFSRDGGTFSLEEKGRAVDAKIRELLRWGAGSPGGKRGRGWPDTFLSTALLGSQDEVSAILKKGLDGDLDESGKDLLVRSLQAIAENSLFRRVLKVAQAKVSGAFTPTGRKRKAKGSPWMETQELIKSRREHLNYMRRLGANSSATKLESEGLKAQVQNAELAHGEATAELQRMEVSRSQQEVRVASEQSLAGATEERDRILGLYTAVEVTQTEIDQAKKELSNAEETSKDAKADRLAAEAQREQAEQRILDLESNDTEQARKIRRQEIEKRLLELKSRRTATRHEAELAKDALDKGRNVSELGKSISTLERHLAEVRSVVESARVRIEQEKQTLNDLTLFERYGDYQSSIRSLVSAKKAGGKAAELRTRAEDLKDKARTLHDEVAALGLPTADALRELAELERKLALAEARVELSLLIRPRREIEVSIDADEGPTEISTLSQPETFKAHGIIRAQIGDAADIEVSGGKAEQRQVAADASRRWERVSAPLFEKFGVSTREPLEDICSRENEKLTESRRLEREAATLEARAEGYGHAESRREELETEAEKTRRSLVSVLPDDTSLDDMASRFEEVKYDDMLDRQELERRIASKEEQAQGLKTKIAVDEGQLESQKGALEVLKHATAAACEKLSDDPQKVLDRANSLLNECSHSLEASTGELEALDSLAATEVEEARAALKSATEAAEAAIALMKVAEAARDEAKQRADTLEGKLQARKATAEAEDMTAALALVEARKKALDDLPQPSSPISKAQIEEAKSGLALKKGLLENLRREFSKKEGALEQVGGQYVEGEIKDAEEALIAAQRKENDVELEYGAWQLLLDTLKEAEAEDAVHLGNSLIAPISENMKQLTRGRYVKVSLGPDLSGTSVSVEGSDREFDILSIGTRDQLATLIRLAVAQTVKSALVLDDQLVCD